MRQAPAESVSPPWVAERSQLPCLDVTRRYVEQDHSQSQIIDAASDLFNALLVRKEKLDEAERQVIWALEREGVRLRNIVLTSLPKGEADFDLIMGMEEQDRWLSDHGFMDLEGNRPIAPEFASV